VRRNSGTRKGAFIVAVLDAISKRHSCRSYKKMPIEQRKLDEILEAARLAPSAKNLQDWRFVVATNEDIKNQLACAANDQMFLADASVIIVACSNSDYVMRCGQAIAPIDVAIALEHIALQAADLGLATCWIGSFYPEKIRKILSIPEDIKIIELMALGYPKDALMQNERLSAENIVSYNKWQF